ncbi:choice-of-anchor D domain-containing protein [Archangium violaceum]|uniref:choice-of-anchor D domain-containing protein n=1 Tax=Archangium violaceum TaxID=83451 RepID=UPI002B309068|nr:choice-of-anchor D domain-containing protein [Archangium gephyra]
MLRLNVLAVVFLGVLVSCGRSAPEGAASADAVGREAKKLANTTSLTPFTVTWSGSTGTSCLNGCRTGATYACSTDSTNWVKGASYTDATVPIPSNRVVVEVRAEVFGRCLDLPSGVTTGTVEVFLNTQKLGEYTATKRDSCPTGSRTCDLDKVVTYTNTNGIPGYNYTGTNTLKLGFLTSTGYKYCASHASITLTHAQRVIDVAPVTVDFGKQKVNTSSLTRTVTVSNDGGADVTVDELSFNASLFDVSPGLPLTVTPGSHQDLSVTFHPTDETPIANSPLVISSNDPLRGDVTVLLSGRGVPLATEVSTSSIDFGEQPVGADPKQEKVTVTNFGSGTLSVSHSFTGDAGTYYSVSPLTLLVDAGTSGELTVSFDPEEEGDAPVSLTLSSAVEGGAADGGTAVEEIPIALFGKGVSPEFSVDSSLRDFGEHRANLESKTLTVEVINTGTGTLKLTDIAISGLGAAGFSTPPSTLDVPQGETGNISVTFEPKSSGLFEANLTFNSNQVGGTASASIPLQGQGVQPAFTVDSSLRDFGEQRVNLDSRTLTVVVTNSGTGTLKLTDIAISGTGVAGFSTPPSTLDVLEGETGNISVKFEPRTGGRFSANLTFNSNKVGGGASASIPLTGYGVQPAFTVDSSLRDFGEQRANLDSRTLTVVVTNSGTGTLKLSDIAIGGTGAAGFSVTSSTLDVLEGETGNIAVKFEPRTGGTFSANLTFNSNKVGGTTSASIPLAGYGVQPAFTVDSSPRDFGEQRVNLDSRTLTVVVTNSGTGTLKLSDIAISGTGVAGFSTPPSTLDVLEGGTGNIAVKFEPRTAGRFSANLTFNSNKVGGSASASIPLAGYGVQPAFTVDSSPRDFGEQRVNLDSRTLTVVVTNSGTGTLKLKDIAIGGTGAAGFSVTSSTLDVLEGETGNIAVKFEPRTGGTFSANLTFNSNKVGGTTSASIPLAGYGVQPAFTVDSSLRDFGEQRANLDSRTLTVVVTNSGTGTLKLTDIAIGGTGAAGFSVTSSTLDVLEGGTGNIAVKFEPRTGGTFSANLTFNSNKVGGTTSASIPLAGYGVQPAFTVDSSPRDFGEQRVNLDSRTITVVVTNSGTGTLKLSDIAISGTGVAGFSTPPSTLDVLEGGTGNIAVTFEPRTAGRFSANLTFNSNHTGGASSATIPLAGYGVQPAFTVDSSLRDFGEQRVNLDSRTLTVVVTNSGTGTLKLTNIALGGTGAAGFSVASSTLDVLEGGTGNIAVTFEPKSGKRFTANLTFNTNKVGAGASATIPLAGYGVQPAFTVDSTLRDFGEQRVNLESRTITVEVTNSGTGILKLTDIAVSGTGAAAFSVTSSTLDVLEGGTGNIAVKFEPKSGARFTANLTFNSNLVGSSSSASIPLAGYGVQPAFTVDTSLRDFGRQAVNSTSLDRRVVVTNSGTGTLKLTDIAISGTGMAAFSVTPSTLNVPEGTNGEISLRFAPKSESRFDANLTFNSNQVGRAPVSILLTGVGVRSAAEVVHDPLAFGNQRVNTTSASKKVTVLNSGSITLRISSISIPAGKPFKVEPPAAFDLLPGGTKELFVTFQPTSAGEATSELTLATSDPDRPTINLPLSGTGIRPIIDLTPTLLSFGDQQEHVTSATRKVTVHNGSTATASLNVSVASITGAFALTSSAPFELAPGTSRELFVTFTPTGESSFTGLLTLNTDDPDRPTVTVTLTGTGVRPVFALAPSALNFGSQRVGSASVPLRVTVSNNGTGVLQVSAPVLSGPFSVTPAGSFAVPEGGSQELQVTFSPSALGSATGTLSLDSNDVARPTATVYLSGTGVTLLDTSPSTTAGINFGVGRVDETSSITVTLTNHSTIAVRLTSFSVGAPFSVSDLDLSTPMAGGTSRSFKVNFKPTGKSTFSGELRLLSDAFNSPHVWNLSGQGDVANAVLAVYPASGGDPVVGNLLDFGNVRMTTSSQRKVRLTNTGGVALNFTKAPSLSGDTVFVYSGPSSQKIPPGASIEFQVSFTPTRSVPSNGILSIDSDAENSPSLLTLSGTGTFSEVKLDRNSIFFGDVRVGDSSFEAPIIITNTGTAPVTIQSLPVTGAFEVPTSEAFRLPKTIAPNGGQGTFNVIFKPSAQGSATGTITVSSDANTGGSQLVSLSGTGTIAVVGLTPDPVKNEKLSFSGQRVNTPSIPQPVIIMNSGRAPLKISSFTFSSLAYALSPVPTLPFTIGPGAQREVYVAFTPAAVGSVTGRLFMVTDAFAPPPALDLTGSGLDGQMTLAPNAIEFEPVEVGTTSGAQLPVKLSNTGSFPLKVQEVLPPTGGAFTVSGLSTGLQLAPGAELPFFVTFKPTIRGSVSGNLRIVSDAKLNPEINLALSGTGVAPAVELSPSDGVQFGDSNVGSSTTQNVSIKNVGEGELYVANFSFKDYDTSSAGQALDFHTTATFPLTVPSKGSVLVPLVFTPKANGVRKARILFYTNDLSKKDAPAEVVLEGTGTAPLLVLSPMVLDFKSVPVGSPSAALPVTLTNDGDGPLNVSSVELSGADAASFLLTPLTTPFVLPKKTSTNVSLTFRPDAKRRFTAQLTVKSNDGSGSRSVVLSGQGDSQIQLSSTILDFGQQLINNTSRAREVVITNNSSEDIVLSSLSVEGTGATQFSRSALTLPLILPPNGTQALGLSFTPLTETHVDCRLRLTFAVPSVELEVGLIGQGIASVLSVDKTSLDFGTVRSRAPGRTELLTLTNRSSEEITLDRPEEISSKGVKFTYDGASLVGKLLGPGKSITLPVSYEPQAETLSETTLGFGTLTPSKPRGATVVLNGRATNRILEVSPADRLEFGRIEVGSKAEPKEITVTNKSLQNLRVTAALQPSEGSPFSLVGDPLDAPIPPGGSVTLKVAFNPLDASEAKNEVQLTLEGDNSPEVRISLTGQGRILVGQGGGCSCGTTEAGSAGMLMLLALVGLGSRRRKRE